MSNVIKYLLEEQFTSVNASRVVSLLTLQFILINIYRLIHFFDDLFD